MMTLNQYLNQKDPTPFTRVLVSHNEVIFGPSIELANGEVLTEVYFNAPELTHAYIVKGKDKKGVLFTTDNHGNPKMISCFTLI